MKRLEMGEYARRIALGALVWAATGCVLSPESFEQLKATVSDDNDCALAAAETSLLTREGLTAVDATDRLSVGLSQGSARRCLLSRNPALPRREHETAPADGEEVELVLQASKQEPTVVHAALSSGCAFIEGSQELTVTLPDHSQRQLARWSAAKLARAADGQLVDYQVSPRLVRTRDVTVEMTCDHMPRVKPSVFEQPPSLWAEWKPEKPRRRLEATYDAQSVEHTCTENTF